jgi:4-amino-4-deoxy-L-arabinose transferase-like glycosyltransferase
MACCLIALALGAWALDARSLWGDEAFSVWASKQPALTLLAGLDAQPPLYHWLLAAARGLWGESVFAIRYLSVFCGVLLVAVGARLGRELGGGQVSVLTAFILATSPILIYFEQEARMYALAALLAGGAMLVMSNWLFVMSAHAQLPITNYRSRIAIAGYVLLSIASLFTHFYTVGVLAVNSFALGITALRSRDVRRMVEWVIAHGAIALVFGGWFFGLQSRYVSRATATRSRIVPIPEEIVRNIGHGLNGLIFGMRADPATTALAIALFVAALMGVIGYWRRGKRAAAALIVGWVFTSLIVVLLTAAPSGVVNDFNPRYFLFALLPLALAASGWLLVIGNWRLEGAQSPITNYQLPVAYLIVILLALPGLTALFDPSWAKSRYAALVDAIRERARPGDGVVLVNSDQFPLIDFYGQATPPTLIVPNGQLSSDVPAVQAMFDNFAHDKRRVWLVNYGWAQALQPRSVVEQQLNASAVRTYSQGFQDASLALYDLDTNNAGGPVTPQFVNFGDEIALTGVRQPALAYRPGEAITLDLIWQAEQKPKADYTVFMHLRRAGDGGQIAAFDSPPVNGSSPTSSWSQGQIITDTRAIQIPADAAPGNYNVVIGLYQYPTFERLPIVGQDGAEHIVGTVTIGQP